MARSTIIFGQNLILTIIIRIFHPSSALLLQGTGYFPYEASLLMLFSPKCLFTQQL